MTECVPLDASGVPSCQVPGLRLGQGYQASPLLLGFSSVCRPRWKPCPAPSFLHPLLPPPNRHRRWMRACGRRARAQSRCCPAPTPRPQTARRLLRPQRPTLSLPDPPAAALAALLPRPRPPPPPATLWEAPSACSLLSMAGARCMIASPRAPAQLACAWCVWCGGSFGGAACHLGGVHSHYHCPLHLPLAPMPCLAAPPEGPLPATSIRHRLLRGCGRTARPRQASRTPRPPCWRRRRPQRPPPSIPQLGRASPWMQPRPPPTAAWLQSLQTAAPPASCPWITRACRWAEGAAVCSGRAAGLGWLVGRCPKLLPLLERSGGPPAATVLYHRVPFYSYPRRSTAASSLIPPSCAGPPLSRPGWHAPTACSAQRWVGEGWARVVACRRACEVCVPAQ